MFILSLVDMDLDWDEHATDDTMQRGALDRRINGHLDGWMVGWLDTWMVGEMDGIQGLILMSDFHPNQLGTSRLQWIFTICQIFKDAQVFIREAAKKIFFVCKERRGKGRAFKENGTFSRLFLNLKFRRPFSSWGEVKALMTRPMKIYFFAVSFTE